MTQNELKAISKEIDHISRQISCLDPCNVIESQKRRKLFHRWDFLDYQLDQALFSVRKNQLRVVNQSNHSLVQSHNNCVGQPNVGRHYKSKKCTLRIVF